MLSTFKIFSCQVLIAVLITRIYSCTASSVTTVQTAEGIQNSGPKVGYWSLHNEQGTACLLAIMAIQLNLTNSDLPYLPRNTMTNYRLVNAPRTASASGYCQENGTSFLQLQWKDDYYQYSCDFQFKMTHKPAGKPVSEWKMDQLDVIISPKNKTVAVNSNQSVDLYVKPQTLILAMTGFSHQTFVCHQGYDFQFQPQDGSIRINNIKLQPFDVTNGQFSYKVFYCPSKDKHQDRRFHQSIAPLIVGGVLAIITVIVLIVYVIVLLVARYRDKDHYQTVTDLQH